MRNKIKNLTLVGEIIWLNAVTIIIRFCRLESIMSELSGHDCPRCNVELYVETNEQAEGVDLLICKKCWGVGVAAKSMEDVIAKGSILDEKGGRLVKTGSKCKCPMCSTIMDEIELDIPEDLEKLNIIDTSKKVIIDSCRNCPTFWFDAGELDLLNGIQPKLRGESRAGLESQYDSESKRLFEDKTLTEEELKKRRMTRQIFGSFAVVVGLALSNTGLLGTSIGILLGLGGFIAIITKDPEQTLVRGTCDKCLKPDKSLAWNCQRGGCWAHICSDCQTIGDDPVETYAKTLGGIAGVIIVGGIAILAIAAVAEGGGAGMGSLSLPGGGGSSEKKGGRFHQNMLLCRECVEVAKKEDEEHEFRKLKAKGGKKYEEGKAKKAKAEIGLFVSDGYCSHKDKINGKRCRRVEFRNTGYCYVHKE